MKAILINPKTKTIEAVETDGSLKDIYRLTECHCIDGVGLERRNYIWVDDEGLYNSPDHIFVVYGTKHLAGNGLVLGLTGDGDNASTTLTLERVKSIVTFPDLEMVDMETYEDVIDHPILGPNTPLIGTRPIFRRKPSV